MGDEVTASLVRGNFIALGGSSAGAGWLALLWEAIQGLDDWRDNDPVAPDACERVIHIVLHDLPAHPFFRAHAAYLLPHLSTLVLKWRGANAIESAGTREDLPKAYMWRAGFYDLVLMALALDVGPDAAGRLAHRVAELYAEPLAGYIEEMTHA